MTTQVESPAESNAGYSRVTLVGRRARADLVLPSTEPIGSLMPEVLRILGEDTAGGPRRRSIATALGDLLPQDATLIGAGILDGAVLRLVDEDEIPPPPVVTDVTEETAGDLERHPGRWGAAARSAVAISTAAVFSGLAGLEIVARDTGHTAFLTLLWAAIGCWAAGAVLGVLRQTLPGVALASCGAAFAAVGAATVADGQGWTRVDRVGAVLVAAAVVLAVAGVGRRARGPLLGAAIGLVLAAGWIVLRRTPLHPQEADALVAVAAVVVLGFLPQWAVTYSGLTSLDDRRLNGDVVPRRLLASALLDAHSGLVWSTVAASSVLATTGVALASAGHQWPSWIAATTALVALLRGRSYPLIAEAVAVIVAAAAVAVALELDWSGRDGTSIWPLASTLAGAAALVGVLVIDPPAHVRARLRMIADRIESVGVLALVPLLVGVFGVFGRLLHTF